MKKNNIILIGVATLLIVLVIAFAIKQFSGPSQALSVDSKNLEEAMEISMNNFPIKTEAGEAKKVCDVYFYIAVLFRAEDQSSLTLRMPCKTNTTPDVVDAGKIPFKHIYSFPPQSGEFTTEATNRILIDGIKEAWPTKWTLEKVTFTNETPEQIFEQKASLNINSESYLKK